MWSHMSYPCWDPMRVNPIGDPRGVNSYVPYELFSWGLIRASPTGDPIGVKTYGVSYDLPLWGPIGVDAMEDLV